MQAIRGAIAAALTVVAVSGVARAEQKLGVEVYPGATALPARSAEVQQRAGVEAACYRTAASHGAVTAFYSRMRGVRSVQPHVFRFGGTDVVLRLAADGAAGSRPTTSFCIMQARE